MARHIDQALVERLLGMLVERRHAARLSQAEVARKLRRHQPFIANIESGQRRLDVIEFLMLSRAIGFDPVEFVAELVTDP